MLSMNQSTEVAPPAGAKAPKDQPKGKFSYKAWYQANKTRLSQKKAKLYAEDASYREAQLERSNKNRKKPAAPDLGPYTVAFKDAADQLGVTIWQLREWRRKDYFPEPKMIGNRMYLTPEQVGWLGQLGQFFHVNGPRASVTAKEELSNLIALVYANW